MIRIDLITGFLGSGKTTFLRKYANYLMAQGEKIGILENDYGAVNVDMMLLQDLEGSQCELEMVAGGCDYDCHRRRFKTKLIAMGMSGYDRVLVEPSGIFDVDEFFDVLYEEPLNRWYEIGNVIAIVDAGLEKDLSEESEYLLAAQTANAGCIVLSRSQEVSAEDIRETKEHLNRAMEKVQCGRRWQVEEDGLRNQESSCLAGTSFQKIFEKDWKDLTGEDFQKIASCGYVAEDHVKFQVSEENSYSSLYFMNYHLSEQKLREIMEKLFADKSCGNVFRIKGFLRNGEDQWLELNATRNKTTVSPIPRGQEVLIVIGESLSEAAIHAYLDPYKSI